MKLTVAKRTRSICRVLLILMIFSLFVTGCGQNIDTNHDNNNGGNEYIEAGLYFDNNSSEPTPWLATAIKAQKTQETVVNFTVYAGYEKDFFDKWNNKMNTRTHCSIVFT